jgi:hypothetical protein
MDSHKTAEPFKFSFQIEEDDTKTDNLIDVNHDRVEVAEISWTSPISLKDRIFLQSALEDESELEENKKSLGYFFRRIETT